MLRVAVATSGGRDSTALLHATVREARALGVEVFAFHVHHGLQVLADDWLIQVRRQARRWGVGFEFRRLQGHPAAGESIEAWARKGRYAALSEMAAAVDCHLLLLAHHRRDQAETWLLQALRGSGPVGLAAMPVAADRGGVVWARPWLGQPREAIEAYVRRHRIAFVDDPSNADPRHARNRLRLSVWPALSRSFPGVEQALVAASVHAQAAAELAFEILANDLPALVDGEGLKVDAWQRLPPARRRNALSGWLKQQLGRGAPGSLIERLIDEIPRCRTGKWRAPAHELHLYRGLLKVRPAAGTGTGTSNVLRTADAEAAPPCAAGPDPLRPVRTLGTACPSIDLSEPGVYPLSAWGGAFVISRAVGGGVLPVRLQAVQALARVGGERFRLAPAGIPRSLKKQFQSCAIPREQRGGPLLFDATDTLIFVPGLGIDAAVCAGPGVASLDIAWMPEPVAR